MGIILLENMIFHAFHGVIPEEQIVGNTYSVTIKISCDFSNAAQKDELDGTINYATIYNLVKQEMAKKSRLIEHVAYRIQKCILFTFPKIKNIEIRLSKHNPPIEGEMEKATVIVFYPDNNLLSKL